MHSISMKEFNMLYQKDSNVQLIDVREYEEYASGHVKTACLIPLGELLDRYHELDPTKHYYLICRSGSRSHMGCELLRQLGIQATNVEGGMLEWEGEIVYGI